MQSPAQQWMHEIQNKTSSFKQHQLERRTFESFKDLTYSSAKLRSKQMIDLWRLPLSSHWGAVEPITWLRLYGKKAQVLMKSAPESPHRLYLKNPSIENEWLYLMSLRKPSMSDVRTLSKKFGVDSKWSQTLIERWSVPETQIQEWNQLFPEDDMHGTMQHVLALKENTLSLKQYLAIRLFLKNNKPTVENWTINELDFNQE